MVHVVLDEVLWQTARWRNLRFTIAMTFEFALLAF